MTFEELLRACSHGKMPQVKANIPIRHAGPVGNTGIVSTIKDNGKHRGIGVMFTGIAWEVWFTDSTDTDIHTINGTNYVRIDYLVASENGINKAKRLIKKHDCIMQGGKPYWQFFRRVAIIVILVPEKNIMAFNQEVI